MSPHTGASVRRLAPIVLSVALVAPVLVTSPAATAAALPVRAENVETQADTATSVRLCWSSDSDDVDHWLVRVAAGTEPPTTGDRTIEVPAAAADCPVVAQLDPEQPYSFAVSGVNSAGEGPATSTIGATRAEGQYVAAAGNGVHRVTSDQPAQVYPAGAPALAVSPSGRQHVAVAVRVQGRSSLQLGYLSRPRGGSWSAPVVLSSGSQWDEHAFISVNRRGAVLVAWNGARMQYRLRPAGAAHFGAVQNVPHVGRLPHLDGAVLDNRGRVHLLYDEISGRSHPLRYRSNSTGRWSTSTVVARTCPWNEQPETCNPALLTYDPEGDRLALVEQHVTSGRTEVRVATKAAGATRFPGPRLGRSSPQSQLRLLPTSVVTRRGRTMVALRGLPPLGQASSERAGIYLLDGPTRGRWHFQMLGGRGGSDIGDVVPRPGLTVSGDDGGPRLASVTARRVVIAYQHDGGWDPKRQGIFRVELERKKYGAWSRSLTHHIASSAYDVLSDLVTDRRGRPAISFARQ